MYSVYLILRAYVVIPVKLLLQNTEKLFLSPSVIPPKRKCLNNLALRSEKIYYIYLNALKMQCVLEQFGPVHVTAGSIQGDLQSPCFW